MLDILDYHVLIHGFLQFFIYPYQSGQILPSSWSSKIFAIYCALHLIKISRSCIQIGNHCRVNAFCVSILSPCVKIRLHLDFLHTVHGHHIKFTDRFIVLRWIPGSYDQPAFRNLVASKGFTLKELQHGRCQCLGNTVDLINKQNPLPKAGILDFLIDGCYDLAHGIFCNCHLFSVKILSGNKRKSNCTLSGMVGNGVRNQSHLTFPGNLLHDLCLADSRGANKKNRALGHNRYLILPVFIFQKVSFYCIAYFFLRSLDVHNIIFSSSLQIGCIILVHV